MCRGLRKRRRCGIMDLAQGDDGGPCASCRESCRAEGSSNMRKLARARGIAGLNLWFLAKAPKPGRFLCLRGLAALVLVHPRVHPLQKRLRRQALLKIVDRVPHAEGQRAGQRAGLL